MPQEQIEFVDATLSDIASLIALFQESESFHRRNRPDIFAQPTVADLRGIYEKYLQDAQVKTILAKARAASVAKACGISS